MMKLFTWLTYDDDGPFLVGRDMAMVDGASIGDGDNNCYLTKR
jgi:hypothetical protein